MNSQYIDDVHGYDFYNNDGDPFADEHWHATHVAGTIAGVGDNNIGVAGVNWQAKVMALRFMGASGGYTSDAVLALDYALQMGAKISNNSWGSSGSSTALYDAINAANAAGHLFVTSAGNRNENIDAWYYYAFPAEYDSANIITVAAVDHNDNRASFSNYGSIAVDLGAPGVSILSSIPTSQYPAGYGYANGTSMAAPHVAGAASLLWGRYPMMSMQEVKTQLLNTVDPTSSMSGRTVTGGRLNINNALDYLDFYGEMAPDSQSILAGDSTTYQLTVSSTSTSNTTISLSLDALAYGLSGSLADTSLSLSAGSSAATTVTINSSADAVSRGAYTIRVYLTNTDGEVTATEAQLTVLVAGHSVSVTPTLQAVDIGNVASYEITVDSIDGFSGDVTLSASASHSSISTNIGTSIGPVVVYLPEDGSVNATLYAGTSSTTPLQIHDVTITATAGAITTSNTVQLEVLDIDLTPTSVTTPSSQLTEGSAFLIDDTINNYGASTSTAIKVALYLSSDAVITEGDTLLGVREIPELLGGQSNSGTSTVAIPSTATPGYYYIGAIVDHLNEITESNEANNSLTGTAIEIITEAGACCSYDVTTVPLPTNSHVQSFNNAGKAVGVTPPYQSGPSKGFYWTAETGQVSYGYYHSAAYAINDAGDVGGLAGGSNRWWSTVIWPNTGGVVSVAGTGAIYGLNDNDLATGYVLSTPRVWRVSTREIFSIDTLGGTYGYGKEVNNNGLVVGYSQTSSGQYHSFSYDFNSGVLTDLGTVNGNSSSYAFDVNDIGQVVGYSGNSAFVYTSGSGMQALPGLDPAKGSQAYAINEEQVIAGYSIDSNNQKNAVIWKNGQIYNLNNFIDPSSGWVLNNVVDISEDGKILGRGYENGVYSTFILTLLPTADVCPSGCGFSTIQAAINAATSGDTITVSAGTYYESITLSNNLTLVSQGDAASTVIDSTGLANSVVYLGNATLNGFTITGGTNTNGAGISVSGSGTVINNIITNNVATASGGGLMLSGGSVLVEGNSFVGNSAVTGGAVTYNSYSSITIRGNTFDGNSATSGGALYIKDYATESISNNTYVNNSASYGGAIMAASYSSPTITNALIHNNTATTGAGIYVPGYSYVNIVNSTIANNNGVGVQFNSYSGSGANNSIIWGNSGGDITRPYYGAPTINYSIVGGGYGGTGNLDVDPLFVDALNADFHLVTGSPAIDTASNSGVTSDIEGNSRPFDGDGLGAGTTGDGSDYDMGAYEY